MALTKVQKEGIETLINNNADNRVITGSGTANTLEGESGVVIDTSGRLLVGHSSNFSGFALQVLGGDESTSSLSLSRFKANASSSVLEFHKSRNNSVGSNTLVQNNDAVGVIRFKAADGTDFSQVADIQAAIDGTPGDNDTPGRLIFSTTADGSQFTTERMRIDSSGRVIIGSTSTIGNSFTNNLTVSEASGSVGMQFEGNNSNNHYASIYFGDAGVRQRAFFEAQLGSDGNFTIGTGGSGPIRFNNSGGERMRIDGSGRVGIGATSFNDAAEYLLVKNDSTASNISIVASNDAHSSLNLGDEDDFNIQKIKSDHTNNSLQFFTNNAERMRIDSSGQVGIGITNPTGSNALFGGTQKTLLVGGSAAPQLRIQSSTSGQADLILQAGNSAADAYIANAASNGDIVFSTNNGSSQGTRLRILDDGGICFNSDTAAANALNDYEEGTWTPQSNAGSISVYSAHYVKVGNKVTFQAYCGFPNQSGSSSQRITNFPFDVAGGSDYHSFAINSDANLGYQLVGQFNQGAFAVFAKPNNQKANITEMSAKFVLFSCTILTH